MSRASERADKSPLLWWHCSLGFAFSERGFASSMFWSRRYVVSCLEVVGDGLASQDYFWKWLISSKCSPSWNKMGWFCLEHLCPLTPICWSLFVRFRLIELLCTDLSNRKAWVEMFYTLEKGMPFLHVTLTYDSASQPFTCTQITWGTCENAGSDSQGLGWGQWS